MISTVTTSSTRDSERTGSGRLKRLGVVIAVVILSLVLLESVFYFARVGESDYLIFDSTVGYKPAPGRRVTSRKEGFSSVTMNSHGMQNDEVSPAKKPGVLRVAVFGDSFVEALQVPRADNYCSLLQRDLSKATGRPVEVLNFGVANYSIAQDFLRYQTLARQFKPDIVIVAYRVSETEKMLPEVAKNLSFVRPVLFADGDKVRYDDSMVKIFAKSKEYKRLKDTDWLRRNSRIWGVIGQMQANWQVFTQDTRQKLEALKADVMKLGTLKTQEQNSHGQNTQGQNAGATAQVVVADEASREAFARCYWPMAHAQLRSFAGEVAKDGGKFYILRTPFTHGDNSTTVANKVESALLKQSASDIGAGFIDVESPYRLEYQRHCSDFFFDHGHFNKRMHGRVARDIAEKLSH